MTNWQLQKEDWESHTKQHECINSKLDEGTQVMNDTKKQVETMCANLEPMLQVWNDAGSVFRVLRQLGRIAKWIAGVGIALSSIVYGFHWLAAHASEPVTHIVPATPGIIVQHYRELKNAKRN